MYRNLLLAATASLCLCAPAYAQDEDRLGIYGGVTGGTLGVGPEVGYRLNDNFGIRANATFLSISHSFDSDDIEYDGRVRLKSAGIMADVYPFGGGFRLSGGVRFNGNKGRATATPSSNQTYEINGRIYTAAEIGSLQAETDIKNIAPALTIGYAGGNRSGFVFGVEAGALFQGGVRLKPFTYTGTIADSAQLRADLEAERLSLQDDIDDYKVYPILQLTIGYRF